MGLALRLISFRIISSESVCSANKKNHANSNHPIKSRSNKEQNIKIAYFGDIFAQLYLIFPHCDMGACVSFGFGKKIFKHQMIEVILVRVMGESNKAL